MVKLVLLFIVSKDLTTMVNEDLLYLVHHLVSSGAHIKTARPTQGTAHRNGRI